MHLEIYTVRVKILRTDEEQGHLLCVGAGETDEDRAKMVEDLKIQLEEAVNFEPYKLLGYVLYRKIYPQED